MGMVFGLLVAAVVLLVAAVLVAILIWAGYQIAVGIRAYRAGWLTLKPFIVGTGALVSISAGALTALYWVGVWAGS